MKDLFHICLETKRQGFWMTFKVSNLGSKQPYFNRAYLVRWWIFNFGSVYAWFFFNWFRFLFDFGFDVFKEVSKEITHEILNSAFWSDNKKRSLDNIFYELQPCQEVLTVLEYHNFIDKKSLNINSPRQLEFDAE